MGLRQYNSLGEHCGPHTASSVTIYTLTLRLEAAVAAGLGVPEEGLFEVAGFFAAVKHTEHGLGLDAGLRAPIVSRQQPVPEVEHGREFVKGDTQRQF